jgi:hypothetical protein
MIIGRTVPQLRDEVRIAFQRLERYREEMARGTGDERVLGAREQICRDALRELRRAKLALDR